MGVRVTVGIAVVVLPMAACSSAVQGRAAASIRYANTASSTTITDSYSASPVAVPVSGTTLDDQRGRGTGVFEPLPYAGRLSVVYTCNNGTMSISRQPDIRATFSCVGGPSVVTFAATTVVNNNPVRLKMSRVDESWQARLILG